MGIMCICYIRITSHEIMVILRAVLFSRSGVCEVFSRTGLVLRAKLDGNDAAFKTTL